MQGAKHKPMEVRSDGNANCKNRHGQGRKGIGYYNKFELFGAMRLLKTKKFTFSILDNDTHTHTHKRKFS